MFCKRCGLEAQGNALYCQNDGTPLTEISGRVTLHKEHNRYCSQCSCENITDSLYCVNCGVMLSKIVEKTGSSVEGAMELKNTSSPVHSFSSQLNLNGFKRSAGFAGLAIMVTFLLSWIISVMLNGKIHDLIASEWTSNLIKDFKFISSTDIMMLSHMIGMKYSGSISILEGSLNISGGFFLLLLIPLVSLLLAGYLSNRSAPQRSAIERLYTITPIVIIYAVLMAVISLFAGVSVNTADFTMMSEGILLKTSYGFMPALLHSLLLGFIFTALGSCIGMPNVIKQQGSNIRYGLSVQRAVISSVVGILICMLLTTSIMYSRAEFSESETPGAIKTIVSTQIGGYYWGLTHFNTLSIGMVSPYDDNETISYSILGGLSSDDEDFDFEELDSFIGGMWYLILVPILLHMWAGRQLLRAQSNRFMYELAAYAVSFGVISTSFTYMSKVRIHSNIEENFVVHFGFSFISSLLLSTLVAFVLAYISVLLFNRGVANVSSMNEQQMAIKKEG